MYPPTARAYPVGEMTDRNRYPLQDRAQPFDGGARMWAPAKINLNLLVGPPGADGYHPLDSFVARISLYDRLDLRLRDDGRITLRNEGAECGPPEENLAFRAAEALAAGEDPGGVEITLHKGIPPGTGLGGGSSDAATVLAGLNGLWELGRTPEQLCDLAAMLGSDVPLFLAPPGARMTGRGEQVRNVPIADFAALLCLPPMHSPTGAVYRRFDELGPPAGEPADRQLPEDLLAEPPSTWRERLVNDLRPAAEALGGELTEFRRALSASAGAPVCLSGSGSAMFVLCDDAAEATERFERLPPDLAERCCVVESNPW